MSNVNLTFQLGRVGKDPEVRKLSDDARVANFSLANSTGYGDKEVTHWHNVQCWNKRADLVEKYVKKGDLLGVFGKIKYRTYENKEGQKVWVTEIEANEIFLMPKGMKTPTEADATFPVDPDETPF